MIFFFFPPQFFLSNVHAGQLECGWKSMLWVCQEEWNWGFDTRIQTVNQRVLGCKLCIISNWVASALLLKSATFVFSSSKPPLPPPPPVNLGRKCRANLQRGTVECWRQTASDDCYSQTNFTVAWKLHFSINQLRRDKRSTSKFKMLSVVVVYPCQFPLPLQFFCPNWCFCSRHSPFFPVGEEGLSFTVVHLLFYDPALVKPFPSHYCD